MHIITEVQLINELINLITNNHFQNNCVVLHCVQLFSYIKYMLIYKMFYQILALCTNIRGSWTSKLISDQTIKIHENCLKLHRYVCAYMNNAYVHVIHVRSEIRLKIYRFITRSVHLHLNNNHIIFKSITSEVLASFLFIYALFTYWYRFQNTG